MTAGTGYRIEAGSQLILRVHYNLLGLAGDTPADQSGLRLRLADGSADLAQLRTTLLPAPVELPCTPRESGPLCDRNAAVRDVASRFGTASGLAPEGLAYLCNGGRLPDPGPTQSCDINVRAAGTVYAVAGHMHLLGRSIKVELNPGTARAQVILDVPMYDFDNQGARELAAPVAVKPGDTYRVTCTHDASLRAQLPALQGLPRGTSCGATAPATRCAWASSSGPADAGAPCYRLARYRGTLLTAGHPRSATGDGQPAT